ncbi:uncharacterized protein [Panulirus ornatus]|uniref:uncharacterized protein n=1 Tax=Panulirus ornatus TaxID=150431 RepID=UPI003A86CDB9
MARCLNLTCTAVAMLLLLFTSAEGCSDKNPSCPVWAANGQCYSNRGYMHVHCAESCHQCIIQDSHCMDLHEQCPAWANNGECTKNYDYMRTACARACTFCQPAKDHTVPHLNANIVDDYWKKFNSLNPALARRHG